MREVKVEGAKEDQDGGTLKDVRAEAEADILSIRLPPQPPQA